MRRDLFPTALCNAARLGLAATLFPASAFTAFAAEPHTIFAPGVSESGGWYDVNKKSTTSQATKDFLFCWGAAASNMAQYWQDCYVKSGHSLPSNVPNGTDSALGYELGIFDVFLDNWSSERGADPYVGLAWYFNGSSHSMTNYAKPTEGTGGYWKDFYNDFQTDLGNNFILPEVGGYSTWGPWASDQSQTAIRIFSDYVLSVLKNGVASIVIKPATILHAVTLWGVDVDALGIVTAVYITDSDDAAKTGQISGLRKYSLTTDNMNRTVSLLNTDYGTVEITNLYGLTAYPIPEPSMFGALAGVFALGLAATRRKLRRPRGV